MPLRRRSFFRRWLIRLALWLVPMCAIWWLGGAEWALQGFRVIANYLLPGIVLPHVIAITAQADQSWKVLTAFYIEGGGQVSRAVFFVFQPRLLKTILGFPLLWALLLATPGRWIKRLLLATALLIVISLLCMAAQMSLYIAVIVNHQPSVIDQSMVAPPFTVAANRYPMWLFYLVDLSSYLAILIVPVIAPVLVWLLLCRRAVMRLLVSVRSPDKQ